MSNALPPCVRCGCPFANHRGWRDCWCGKCSGYSSVEPITRDSVRVGDRLRVAEGYYAGVHPATVRVVDDDGVTLELERGGEVRVSWQEATTGRLQRP
jgi:hypothetical protein